MDVNAWLTSASDDARERRLDGLVPLLDTLARSTRALRAADEASRVQPGSISEPPPQDAS
jgi:hypothetical protein